MTEELNRLPLIGDKAPAFKALTTNGTVNFPDDYAGKWVLFFSHPSDFTPVCTAEQKIKREKDDLMLQLKPTQDIAASLGALKKDRQLLVGFALETNDETAHAQDKLQRKNFDFIVLNSLNDKGAGFRVDTNKITIIDREGATPYPLKNKAEVATDIIDRLVACINKI